MIQVKRFVCLSFSFLPNNFAKFWASLLIQSLDLKISLPLILFLSELWRFWFCTLIPSFCCRPEIGVILLLSNHFRVLHFEPVKIDFKIKTTTTKNQISWEKKTFLKKKIPASLRLLEPVGDVLWFSNVPELVPTREISFRTVVSNCCTFDLKLVWMLLKQ